MGRRGRHPAGRGNQIRLREGVTGLPRGSSGDTNLRPAHRTAYFAADVGQVALNMLTTGWTGKFDFFRHFQLQISNTITPCATHRFVTPFTFDGSPAIAYGFRAWK